jgi:hypothetical protein
MSDLGNRKSTLDDHSQGSSHTDRAKQKIALLEKGGDILAALARQYQRSGAPGTGAAPAPGTSAGRRPAASAPPLSPSPTLSPDVVKALRILLLHCFLCGGIALTKVPILFVVLYFFCRSITSSSFSAPGSNSDL